jgi:uncharacterized protein (DUF39 family)
MKTIAQINERISSGEAVVLTADEVVEFAEKNGVEAVAREVDVVTTATFGAMCSSGAFLNFGHADPPIRMTKILLNDVPAYGGLAAVDTYLGATEISQTEGMNYGGAHVIEDLVAGRRIKLEAASPGTDCYPRREITTYLTLASLNQAYLYNPRNAYQNYNCAVNTSEHVIRTYMGTLLPRMGNAAYATCGQLSPLLNDPYYRTIGMGTRIFLGGGIGYVAWEGTQHNPLAGRTAGGVPTGGAGAMAVIGDLAGMSPEFLRAATFTDYGVTLFVGIGVPIPILDEQMARFVCVRDEDIVTGVYDYSVGRRSRPCLGQVTYKQLRSGEIEIQGKKIRTAPLSSLAKARQIAELLRGWIKDGSFTLTEPVTGLPKNRVNTPLDVIGPEETFEGEENNG